MKRLLLSAVLMLGLLSTAYAQMLMPGPSATLINAQAATTTSSAFSNSGYGIVTFQATSNATAATGTVTYQGSMDNTNWTNMNCWITGTTILATWTIASQSVVSQMVSCNMDGIPLARAVLSPWIGGTWTVSVGASAIPRTK